MFETVTDSGLTRPNNINLEKENDYEQKLVCSFAAALVMAAVLLDQALRGTSPAAHLRNL